MSRSPSKKNFSGKERGGQSPRKESSSQPAIKKSKKKDSERHPASSRPSSSGGKETSHHPRSSKSSRKRTPAEGIQGESDSRTLRYRTRSLSSLTSGPSLGSLHALGSYEWITNKAPPVPYSEQTKRLLEDTRRLVEEQELELAKARETDKEDGGDKEDGSGWGCQMRLYGEKAVLLVRLVDSAENLGVVVKENQSPECKQQQKSEPK